MLYCIIMIIIHAQKTCSRVSYNIRIISFWHVSTRVNALWYRRAYFLFRPRPFNRFGLTNRNINNTKTYIILFLCVLYYASSYRNVMTTTAAKRTDSARAYLPLVNGIIIGLRVACVLSCTHFVCNIKYHIKGCHVKWCYLITCCEFQEKLLGSYFIVLNPF